MSGSHYLLFLLLIDVVFLLSVSMSNTKKHGKAQKISRMRYGRGPADIRGTDATICVWCSVNNWSHYHLNCPDDNHDHQYTNFLGKTLSCSKRGRQVIHPMYLPYAKEGCVFVLAPDLTARLLSVDAIQSLPPSTLKLTHPLLCMFGSKCKYRRAGKVCDYIHLKDNVNWEKLEYCYPHLNFRADTVEEVYYDRMDTHQTFNVLRCGEIPLTISGDRILKTRGSDKLKPGDTIAFRSAYSSGHHFLCHHFHFHGFCSVGQECDYIHVEKIRYLTNNSTCAVTAPAETNTESHV